MCSNTDTYSDSNTYCDTHSDTNAYSNSDTYTYCYSNAYSDSSTHSDWRVPLYDILCFVSRDHRLSGRYFASRFSEC